MTAQLEDNRKAYQERHKERLEQEHFGRYALMRDGEVDEILDDVNVAYELGLRRYGRGNFSLQGIGAKPFVSVFGAAGLAFG